jgi:hypothetical protein
MAFLDWSKYRFCLFALLGFTLRVVKITKYVCNVIFPIVANSIKPSAFVESRARRSF